MQTGLPRRAPGKKPQRWSQEQQRNFTGFEAYLHKAYGEKDDGSGTDKYGMSHQSHYKGITDTHFIRKAKHGSQYRGTERTVFEWGWCIVEGGGGGWNSSKMVGYW